MPLIETRSIFYSVWAYDYVAMEKKNQEPMYSFKAFTQKELTNMSVTKEVLAREMGIAKLTFDYALPQDWLNSFVDNHCPSGTDRDDYYALVRSTCFSIYIGGEMFISSGCIDIQNIIAKNSFLPPDY